VIRRYRGEIFLAVLVIAFCVFVMRAFSQDKAAAPAAATLKPGDEVKPTELEAAKLGKLKAQLDRDDAQGVILQQQYGALQNDRAQVQGKIDAIVKDVQARVKSDTHVDVVYDQRSGEDGTFRVNAPPSPTSPGAPIPAKK
jgi:hypothetical protein